MNNQLVLARYTTDPINGDPDDPDYDWDSLTWIYSSPVTINYTAVGELIPVQYNLSKEEYTQGEYVVVQLTNVDEIIASIRDQAEAADCTIDLNNLDIRASIRIWDNSIYSYNSTGSFSWNGLDQILIPTVKLSLPYAENEVTLNIDTYFESGWIRYQTYSFFQLHKAGNEVFFTNKTQLETAENAELNLLIPNASRVSVWQIDGDSEQMIDWEEGTALISNISYGSAGTYTLKAKIQEGNHGKAWSDEWLAAWHDAQTDNITLTVTSNTNQQLTGSIVIPSRLNPGSSLRVQYSSNQELDQVEITIWRKEDNQRIWHSVHPDVGTISLPYGMPNYNYSYYSYSFDPILPAYTTFLSRSKMYRIEVAMEKRGWEACRKVAYFAVYPAPTETRELRLPDGLNTIEEEAFSAIQANLISIGSDIQAIGQRAFAEIPELVYVDFGSNSDVVIAEEAFDQTNAIFRCQEGSTAQEFAETYGYPYDLQ